MGGLPVGLPVAGENRRDVLWPFNPVKVSVEPRSPDLDRGGGEGFRGHAASRLLAYSSQCAIRKPRIPRPGL